MSVHPTPRRRALNGALAATLATGLGALLVSCSDPDTTGRSAEQGPTDTSDSEHLAELAQQAADAGSLGVIVRIDPGGDAPVEIARQAAWTEDDHRLAVDDRFRVASNTKTMIATLVLRSVERAEMGLDDPVEQWLPAVVPEGGDVTVRMLLNHTSGLDDFLLTPEFLPTLTGQDDRDWTPQELIAVTPVQDPPATLGQTHFYSNANYSALGLILEEATGLDLADLIVQEITGPLGMEDSFLATDADFGAGLPHAFGYEPDAERLRAILAPIVDLPAGVGFVGDERPEGTIDATAINPAWAGAAGGMVSTARDWQTFQTALMSGDLLPEAQMEQMLTMVPTPEEGGGYGLGLMKVDSPCGTVWGHTGGYPGYSSEIYTDATGERSVAVLTTTNFNVKEPEAAAANQALVDTAICAALGEPLPEAGGEED